MNLLLMQKRRVVSNVVTSSSGGSAVAATTIELFNYADNATFLAATGTYASGKKYTTMTAGGAVSLDSGTLYNGYKTSKFRYYTGMSTAQPKFTINNPTGGGDSKLLITWPIRFEPGFRNIINNSYSGAKALKTFQLGFSGVNGRVLGVFTNGGVGGDSDMQLETVTRTNENTFLNVTSRRGISGSSDVYNDGQWYRYAVYFERLSSHSYRVAYYFGFDQSTLPCLTTFVMRDEKVTTVNGIFDMDIGFYFNPLETGSAGPGIDQWFNIGQWEVWRGNDVPTYTSLTGSIVHPITNAAYLTTPDFTNNDFSVSMSATMSLVAGGAPVSNSILVTRGSGFSTATISIESGSSASGTPLFGFNVPSGVTAAFDNNNRYNLTSGINSSTMSLVAASGAPATSSTAYLNFTTSTTRAGATVSMPILITVV